MRIAPDEISFAKAEAWPEIFQTRPGHLPFPKNPVWWSAQPGQPDSIISVRSTEDHSRIRRLLQHGFTERAVKEQEPILQGYVGMLIDRLRERATSTEVEQGGGAALDIVQWLNFTTFDIVGDLSFGESFNCLRDSKYHPWMALIFNHFRASTLVAAVRFYPMLDALLSKCLPKSVMKIQRDHYQLVVDKVQRRLNLDVERPDFMSHVIRFNDDKGMSQSEIEATFNIIIVAGSETTATTLSGALNHLIRNPDKLRTLIKEIRTSFPTEEAITLSALRGLPYLNAVLHEGLRLCPPIPAGLPRMVPEGGDTVCGQWMPDGTAVSVHAWTLSLLPTSFHDSLSFHPERWLDESAKDPASPFFSDERHAVQPFSVGPRHCIGKVLAWAELRLILARLLWAFDIEATEVGKRVRWEDQRTWMLWEKLPFEIRIRKATYSCLS